MSEQQATVITGAEAIEGFRRAAIESGLKLESLGMKHSRGSVKAAAQQLLTQAGLKPERNKIKLYEQFKAWRAQTAATTAEPAQPLDQKSYGERHDRWCKE